MCINTQIERPKHMLAALGHCYLIINLCINVRNKDETEKQMDRYQTVAFCLKCYCHDQQNKCNFHNGKTSHILVTEEKVH